MSATAHRCPRCAAHLFVGTAAGMVLHACGACGGVFLGTACARRLLETVPREAVALAGNASRAARHAPDLSAPAPCPMCGAAMQRRHAAAAGVELDVCAPHGTWYDRDEIEKVARAIEGSAWRAPAAVAGAVAVGGVATASAIGGAPVHSTAGSDVALGVGTEVALEVGAEVVAEGLFAIIGALFD